MKNIKTRKQVSKQVSTKKVIHKKASVECECGGRMTVVAGGETAWMLLCGTCKNFYYRIGAVSCIGDKMPKDTAAADRLLGGSQRLRPEWEKKIKDFEDKVKGWWKR